MTSKNFNSTVKPNTIEEQVQVLTALVNKLPVFFYSWNDTLTKMEVQKYVSTTAPDFSMYRFDTEGKLLRYKSAILFHKGTFATESIRSVSTGYGSGGLTGAQLNAWFDGDTLCIEPIPGAKLRWVVASDPLSAKAAVGTSLVEGLPNVGSSFGERYRKVYAIWQREQKKLVLGDIKHRTLQPYWSNPLSRHRREPDYLHLPNSYELRKYPAMRVLIRFDDCVAISERAISRDVVLGWKLRPYSKVYTSYRDDRANINGYDFKMIRQ